MLIWRSIRIRQTIRSLRQEAAASAAAQRTVAMVPAP
jgi:hypothetical protein